MTPVEFAREEISPKRFKCEAFANDIETVPCAYCGRMLRKSEATVDHKIPRYRGGTNARKNLAIACAKCNEVKGHETPRSMWKRTSGLRLWQKVNGIKQR